MINKLVTLILQSNLMKFFLVGLTVAILQTFFGHFSVFPWFAVILATLPLFTKVVFVETALNYDQRQQIIYASLFLSSIVWSIFMWKDLHNLPQSYSFVFVSISVAALIAFDTIKYRLLIIMPLLITYVLLLTFVIHPTANALAVFTVIISLLFLFNIPSERVEGNSVHQPSKANSTDKMELVSEVDTLKTENHLLQNQIKQIEIDLSAAEMAKMEFLATMSHEIRTPLNGIIPLLDILLDSELSDFQKDYLSTAHISAIQMQKLIDDLLDYSKVEAGKLTVETRGLKILRILSAVNASYQQAAQKKNLSIEVDVHNNVSPLLRGDPTRLRQVLSNLLSNAIKFSNSGTITLTARKIKNSPNKEVIRFEVADQGIGLDKETSDSIFLPFTQEDGSSTRKFGGTGLGLAISKKIVELMQGTIAVESAKGKGSTFYFDLPLLKSMGETDVGLSEKSNYQAILVNTNPLLFNKISKKLKDEDIGYQKALGIAQAYEIYASINKVSNIKKNVLVFIDFETAGKQVRSLCNDLASDDSMKNLYACIITENNNIAGIPHLNNIKLLSKEDSFGEMLNRIEVAQASLEANKQTLPSGEENGKSESSQIDNKEPLQPLLPEILLVEDNEVNLKVAEKLIQYIGYPFDFAMNGQEALEKVKKNRYRMILMDCQMPIMDGYRCTSKVRDYETAAGLNRTPILAMTANAMMGDREKCLDAGMDDYMSKPLNRYILEKTLKKWDPLVQADVSAPVRLGKRQVKTNDKTIAKQTSSSSVGIKSQTNQSDTNKEQIKDKKPTPVINEKWLSLKTLRDLTEFMGDEIVPLLLMFEQETPSIINKMKVALKRNNIDEVKKMAHMLKSTSANIGANGLSFFSRKMELAAKEQQKSELNNIYNKITKVYALTQNEISKYIKIINNS